MDIINLTLLSVDILYVDIVSMYHISPVPEPHKEGLLSALGHLAPR